MEMTQERNVFSDSESESEEDTTESIHATASNSPGKKSSEPLSKKIKIGHPHESHVTSHARGKKLGFNPPTLSIGLEKDISRTGPYADYYCDPSSSITFLVNGVSRSMKQKSIFDVPSKHPDPIPPSCTVTSTTIRPNHPGIAASGNWSKRPPRHSNSSRSAMNHSSWIRVFVLACEKHTAEFKYCLFCCAVLCHPCLLSMKVVLWCTIVAFVVNCHRKHRWTELNCNCKTRTKKQGNKMVVEIICK